MAKIKTFQHDGISLPILFTEKTNLFSAKIPQEMLNFSRKNSRDFEFKSLAELETALTSLAKEYIDTSTTYEEIIILCETDGQSVSSDTNFTLRSVGLAYIVVLKSTRGNDISYMPRVHSAAPSQWSLGNSLGLPEGHPSWRYLPRKLWSLPHNKVELPYSPELESRLQDIVDAIGAAKNKLSAIVNGGEAAILAFGSERTTRLLSIAKDTTYE